MRELIVQNLGGISLLIINCEFILKISSPEVFSIYPPKLREEEGLLPWRGGRCPEEGRKIRVREGGVGYQLEKRTNIPHLIQSISRRGCLMLFCICHKRECNTLEGTPTICYHWVIKCLKRSLVFEPISERLLVSHFF